MVGLGPLDTTGLTETDVFNQGAMADATALESAMREAVAAANRGNVSIYSIDPRGLIQLADEQITIATPADVWEPASGIGRKTFRQETVMSQASLRDLAEDTGGIAVITNNLAPAFERIVSDNSSDYVLAYHAPSTERNGKQHRIDVRVKRPDLTVRARAGYAAPRGRAARPVTGAVKGSDQLLQALATPLAVTGLPIRVTLARFQTSATASSVMIDVEVDGRALALRQGGKIEIAYAAIDQAGNVRGNSDVISLALEKDTLARAQASGIRVINRIELPIGVHQVRVAVRDLEGGAIGSVVTELDVPDFSAAPLAISDIVVTSPRASEVVTVRTDTTLQPVLPAAPAAMRTFSQYDVLTAFAEIYGRGGSPAQSIDIEAMVVGEDGTVVLRSRDTREIPGAQRVLGYSVQLPLQDFKPGRYVLVLDATSRLGPKAVRQLSFSVTSAR